MRRMVFSSVLAAWILVPLVPSTTFVTPRVWVVVPIAIPGYDHAPSGPQRGVTYVRESTRTVRSYPSASIPEARDTRVLRPAPFQD